MEHEPLLSEERNPNYTAIGLTPTLSREYNNEASNVHSSQPNQDNDSTTVVYTVEEAVNHLGFGIFQVLATIFSGLIWVRLVLV